MKLNENLDFTADTVKNVSPPNDIQFLIETKVTDSYISGRLLQRVFWLPVTAIVLVGNTTNTAGCICFILQRISPN